MVGEVYAVDDPTLARLDELEGHPENYRRTPIRLADGQQGVTYLLVEAAQFHQNRIASGDWRTR